LQAIPTAIFDLAAVRDSVAAPTRVVVASANAAPVPLLPTPRNAIAANTRVHPVTYSTKVVALASIRNTSTVSASLIVATTDAAVVLPFPGKRSSIAAAA